MNGANRTLQRAMYSDHEIESQMTLSFRGPDALYLWKLNAARTKKCTYEGRLNGLWPKIVILQILEGYKLPMTLLSDDEARESISISGLRVVD